MFSKSWIMKLLLIMTSEVTSTSCHQLRNHKSVTNQCPPITSVFPGQNWEDRKWLQSVKLMPQQTGPVGLSIPRLASEWLVSQLQPHPRKASVCTPRPQDPLWLLISSPMDSKQLWSLGECNRLMPIGPTLNQDLNRYCRRLLPEFRIDTTMNTDDDASSTSMDISSRPTILSLAGVSKFYYP